MHSQTVTPQATVQPAKPVKHPYWKFLKSPDHRSANHMFMFGYNFLYNSMGVSFGSTGTIPWVGFNVARLFSRKIILGVIVEAKLSPGNWKQVPSQQFINDFDSSFVKKYDNPLDSVNAYLVKNAINDAGGQYVAGQNILNYGIAFSPFPSKYGGIMIQIKYGKTAYQVQGLYGQKMIKGGGYEQLPMRISNNIIYECTFKPYALGGNAYVLSNLKRKNDLWKSIAISVYYEQLNIKSAVFNGTRIDQMVAPGFLDKYGVDKRVGFKIGLSFY
jgi:hypothetical protein